MCSFSQRKSLTNLTRILIVTNKFLVCLTTNILFYHMYDMYLRKYILVPTQYQLDLINSVNLLPSLEGNMSIIVTHNNHLTINSLPDLFLIFYLTVYNMCPQTMLLKPIMNRENNQIHTKKHHNLTTIQA